MSADLTITEVTVSCSTKINNGNYESTDYFISLKAEDPSGIKPGTTGKLKGLAESAILDTVVAQYRAKGVKTTYAKIARQHGLANASRAKSTDPI